MNKTLPFLLVLAGLTFAACAEQNHAVNTYTPSGPGVADIAGPDQVAADHTVGAKAGATTGGNAGGGNAGGGNGGAAAGGTGGGGHR